MAQSGILEKKSTKSNIVKEHLNGIASQRDQWFEKNSYYHSQLLAYYQFIIPKGSKILQLGCEIGNLIGKLEPSYGMGVDVSDQMINIAKQKYPDIHFRCENIEEFLIEEKFDYIILSGTLGCIENIQALLQRILKMANSETRIIINHYNALWEPILRVGEILKWKMPEIIFNWLSIDDIENFLYISGYQVVRRDFLLLFPVHIPILSRILNRIIGKLPIIRRLTSTHCIVARPNMPPDNVDDLTSSVILTCRDEEENIQGLVEGIPQMGKHTEIIFVEGHSQDNTVGKIKEMQNKYPDKDIKLLKQKGIGQRDAFAMGFDHAKGDLLCWLEADLTIPPQEIELFWKAYITGKGEYINGSRFIYKMQKDSMPLLNILGNRFFGNVFTMILKQRITDTLCGYKAISRKGYEKVCKQKDYFGDFDPFGDFELILGASKICLKFAEVPVHYRPRSYGSSKAYGKSFNGFLKHAWLLIRMSWIAFIKFRIF